MLKKLSLAIAVLMLTTSVALAWSGQEIWKSSIEYSITTDIVFNDGVIYAGDEHGNVHALNADNGNKLWTETIDGTVVGKPVIIEDKVICAGRNGVIAAFNKKNGNVIWKHHPSRQDGSATFSDGPAGGSGKVYIGGGSAIVYALSASNGELSWTWKASIALLTAPAYASGIVYVGDQNALFSALDANTGNKLWGGGAGAALNTPTIDSKNEYAYFSSEDGSITSVNIKEKTAIWQVFVGDAITTAPEIRNDKIFVGTAIGNIIALSKDNGGVLWNAKIGGGYVNARPVATDGLIFAGSGDGTLYAIETNNGQIRWSLNLGQEINGAACFNNGILYAGSSAGEIIAFR